MVSEEVENPEQGRTGERVGGADLAAILEGRGDEEVDRFVKQAGYDVVLGQIFSEMQARFLPDKAAGRRAVIQYDIGTLEGAESYQAVVGDGTCATRKGTDAEPTVTLVLSLPDFLRLISGKLNGVQAFMSGKLKIRGDMMVAQTMQGWFDPN